MLDNCKGLGWYATVFLIFKVSYWLIGNKVKVYWCDNTNCLTKEKTVWSVVKEIKSNISRQCTFDELLCIVCNHTPG